MKTDELISKYLDGELSAEEDKILREAISADPDLRSEYQFALDMHFACAESSRDLEPPVDFALSVEDMILSRMEQAEKEKKKTPSLVWSRKFGLAFTFAFLVATQISDYFLSPSAFLSNGAVVATNSSESKANAKKVNSEPKKRVVTKNNTESSDLALINDDESSIATKQLDSSAKIEVPKEIAAAPIQTIIALPKQTSAKALNLDNNMNKVFSAQPSFANNARLFNPIEDRLESKNAFTEVLLTSFVGSDFADAGFKDESKSAIKHISQSVGYNVSDNDFIGVEFGYSQYTLTENAQYTKPEVYSAKYKGGNKTLSGGSSNSNSGAPSSNYQYQTATFSYQDTKETYWGTAYYQRSLLSKGNFTLSGRIGVGASSYGALTVGKVFASYKVLPFIYVTAGAEGRAFNGSMQTFDGVSGWNTSASVIYGLQAQF